MFINYSQTYAATITTIAGFLLLIVNRFAPSITQGDLELFLGVVVSLGGIVWQLIHRHSKGDVTAIGTRKE